MENDRELDSLISQAFLEVGRDLSFPNNSLLLWYTSIAKDKQEEWEIRPKLHGKNAEETYQTL